MQQKYKTVNFSLIWSYPQVSSKLRFQCSERFLWLKGCYKVWIKKSVELFLPKLPLFLEIFPITLRSSSFYRHVVSLLNAILNNMVQNIEITHKRSIQKQIIKVSLTSKKFYIRGFTAFNCYGNIKGFLHWRLIYGCAMVLDAKQNAVLEAVRLWLERALLKCLVYYTIDTSRVFLM